MDIDISFGTILAVGSIGDCNQDLNVMFCFDIVNHFCNLSFFNIWIHQKLFSYSLSELEFSAWVSWLRHDFNFDFDFNSKTII